MAQQEKNTLYCSFCGKSQHEVRKLIAGPTVFICDECVELCMDIIREENKNTLVNPDYFYVVTFLSNDKAYNIRLKIKRNLIES